MTAIRLALMAFGIALGAYGAVLLLDNPTKILIRIAVWAGVGVLLHDAVFAPGLRGTGVRREAHPAAVMVVTTDGRRAVQRGAGAAGHPGLRQARPPLDTPSALASTATTTGAGVSPAIVWGAALLILIGKHLLPVGRIKLFSSSAPITLRLSHHRCERAGSSAGAAVSHTSNGSQMRSVSALDSIDRSAIRSRPVPPAPAG